MDDDARAHAARFEGDGEAAIGEAPVAASCGGGGDGEEFGVTGGVMVDLAAVMSAGYDVAGREFVDDGTDGDFAECCGVAGLVEGEAHEGDVAGCVRGLWVRGGAGRCGSGRGTGEVRT